MTNNPSLGFEWNLRMIMAEKGMYQTTDLRRALLAEGLQLSREQVYRTVTRPPSRLSLELLVALCKILDCTPNDLIEVADNRASQPLKPKTGTTDSPRGGQPDISPVFARVRRPRH